MATTNRPPDDRRRMTGILSGPIDDDTARNRLRYARVPARTGTVVTHRASGLFGAVLECTPQLVVLRDDSGRDHRLGNRPGAFEIEGRPVELVTARPDPTRRPVTTASGSIAAEEAPARVARGSRLLVEGIHDAELLEKVWGDDLRYEGVVVQPMDGIDDIASIVRGFEPRPGRRLGILVDHLVDGSKETRLAAAVDDPEVMIRGHRFVDIWEACEPRLLGLESWPTIPREVVWKEGICAAVGISDPRELWRTLLGRVTGIPDLDPSLVGAVEELIDFVTT